MKPNAGLDFEWGIVMIRSKNLKIALLCVFLLAIAGSSVFALPSLRAEAPAPEAKAPAADARQRESAGAPSAAVPMTASPARTTAATSGAATTDRDDLMDDITFTYEDETEAVDMGDDFQVNGLRPAGGKVTPITVNSAVTDQLWNVGDCRGYSFTVESRGVVRLEFDYTVSEVIGTPWQLYLYEAYAKDGVGDADAYRLLSSLEVTSAETGTVQGDKIGLYPGEYLIFVTTGEVCSVDEFTLRLAFLENVAWEAEPNDSKTRYTELPFGVRTGGASASKAGGDVDWFLFELPERGVVNLTFEHSDEELPQVGWLVAILKENGDILYDGRSYYKDISITSGEIGLAAGSYYVRVTSHILSTVDYYLTCSYEPIDTYETELNDTPETANELPLKNEESGVSGSLSDKNSRPDRDYYRFSPERDGVISFSFIHQDFSRNRDGWTIRLLNESGETLYEVVSRWCDMAVTSPQIGLAAGTYYLLVDGEDMLLNSGTYVLGITYAAGDNWESEPNNSVEQADALPKNETVYGTLISTGLSYDTDWFTFDLTQTASVRLLFGHAAQSEDYEGWVIELYDEDGSRITRMTSLWSEEEKQSELLRLAAGKYTVRVDTGARFTDLRYGLTLQYS